MPLLIDNRDRDLISGPSCSFDALHDCIAEVSTGDSSEHECSDFDSIPSTVTLASYFEKLLVLPHVCSAVGLDRPLDINVQSLHQKVTENLEKQASQCHEHTAWAPWCLANEAVLESVENLMESLTSEEPDYQYLSGKSFSLRRQLRAPASFSAAMRMSVGLSAEFCDLIENNAADLDAMVNRDRDFRFNLKGATVMARYSLKSSEGTPTETPQYVYLRTAVAVHRRDLEEVRLLYNLLSEHKFAAPSPCLAYAGQEGGRLATCFTLSKPLRGLDVYDVLKESAALSFGSCGIHFHEVPREQLVSVAKLFDSQAKLSATTNFRKPAQSIYIEPWHDGIHEFLALKRTLASEETVCRDMHLALWIPDEFMRRVRDDKPWPLLSPTVASHLANCHGDCFVECLNRLVEEGKHSRFVPARALWRDIIASQIECGEPSILYKDAVNRKSNETHMGTVRGSNLCTEIVQFCDSDTTAVCCVMTLSFPAFVHRKQGCTDLAGGQHSECQLDLDELRHCARAMQRMADRLTESAAHLPSARARGALRTRSLGLGGQGVADALQMLRLPFNSQEGIATTARLYEHLYFAALQESAELAERHGPHERFEGSPASQGVLQWQLWAREGHFDTACLDPRLDWEELSARIQRVGLRNSLLTAQPPTAVSASILGNNEGAEPFTSNMYTRSDVFGDFWVINRHLVDDLKQLARRDATFDLPNAMKELLRYKGSVQQLKIPDELKRLYLTAWEIALESPDFIVRHSAARGPFIDQAESMNLFLRDGEPGRLDSSLFAAWTKGLKVGMYYLVMRPAREAVAFTVPLATKSSDESATLGNQEELGDIGSDSGEPLLVANADRHVLFPIKYKDVWKMYKEACALLWSADELDYDADANAFNSLDLRVQHVIKTLLAFFVVADGVVNENIVANFGREVTAPEVRAMYSLQAFVEEVHAETYSRLLLAVVSDPIEEKALLTAHRSGSHAIMAKVKWAESYMTEDHTFPERLLAFACVEGIMFSASFAAIFYIKHLKIPMPALINSNEFISRDEGLHRDFAVLLYKSHVQQKLTEAQVQRLIRDAVAVEALFVRELFGEDGLVGMSTSQMITYVEVVADHLSKSLGYSSIFGSANPFPWMDMISSESKTDRFCRRNTAYRQPGQISISHGCAITGTESAPTLTAAAAPVC
eukprot:TRINITY_DN61364_c0_g1_i1.p1 TRINITY_DN61364_c0_g1~~TRINITY_DN61364_c0_g1_i1.p1  ORF type:complete len:1170 (+),score=196.28 TRINITY_DN61364_c0_g1_i1:81-3590(+)